MKKKLWIGLFSALFIAVAIIGTMAYFTKNFSSDKNFATAEHFNVDAVTSDGKTIGDAQFNLSDKLFPGMDTVEAYSFQINKNDTKLPVEYKVNFTPSGDLFPQDGSSPVKLTLQRNVDDNNWVKIDYTTEFKPEKATESFKVLVEWPHSDNDIDFQGKTGNIHLEVVATQVDAEAVPEEPEEPAGPPYYTKAIEFKATPNGSTFKTSEQKEINFYVNDKGFKVIEVTAGEGTGTFENKVGNFTVTEEIVNGIKYFRVITAKEYYASPSQIWRARADDVDISVKGTVKFKATLAPFLLIESDAFYDWFIKNK